MKSQFPLVQVFKHPQRDPPHSPLRDPRKHGIPQFAEQGGTKTQATVGHHQHNRDPQQHVGTAVLVQVVDNVFQCHRGGDGGQLCQDQHRHSQHDPPPEFQKIRPQPGNNRPVGLMIGGVVVVGVGSQCNILELLEMSSARDGEPFRDTL